MDPAGFKFTNDFKAVDVNLKALLISFHGILLAFNLLFMVVFWTVGGLFLYVDLYNKPTWVMKYKTQPGMNTPVCCKKYKKKNGIGMETTL